MADARVFTFAELWGLAMDDPDFASGKIDAFEVMDRITGRKTERPSEEERMEFCESMFPGEVATLPSPKKGRN